MALNRTPAQQEVINLICDVLPFDECAHGELLKVMVGGLRALVDSTDFTFEVRADHHQAFYRAAGDNDSAAMLRAYLAAADAGAIQRPTKQLRKVVEEGLASLEAFQVGIIAVSKIRNASKHH